MNTLVTQNHFYALHIKTVAFSSFVNCSLFLQPEDKEGYDDKNNDNTGGYVSEIRGNTLNPQRQLSLKLPIDEKKPYTDAKIKDQVCIVLPYANPGVRRTVNDSVLEGGSGCIIVTGYDRVKGGSPSSKGKTKTIASCSMDYFQRKGISADRLITYEEEYSSLEDLLQEIFSIISVLLPKNQGNTFSFSGGTHTLTDNHSTYVACSPIDIQGARKAISRLQKKGVILGKVNYYCPCCDIEEG